MSKKLIIEHTWHKVGDSEDIVSAIVEIVDDDYLWIYPEGVNIHEDEVFPLVNLHKTDLPQIIEGKYPPGVGKRGYNIFYYECFQQTEKRAKSYPKKNRRKPKNTLGTFNVFANSFLCIILWQQIKSPFSYRNKFCSKHCLFPNNDGYFGGF